MSYVVSKTIILFNRVQHLPVEDLASTDLPPVMSTKISSSALQMVLLSPTFLHFLSRSPQSSLAVGPLLHPDRVLAVMLGVKDSQILPEHKAGKNAHQFICWINSTFEVCVLKEGPKEWADLTVPILNIEA